MPELRDQRRRRRRASCPSSSSCWNLIGRCFVSLVSTSLTQFALFKLPYFFPASSLLILLALSALVLLGLAGFQRSCKRFLRLRVSAPAFVFFNIIFIWGFYWGVVRQVIAPKGDFILNVQFLMLITGLCCMLSSDPGYITNESSHVNKLVENPVSGNETHSEEVEECKMAYGFAVEDRVRYCTHCEEYVKGFDHHCPAFGNCIGQKNHVLFIVLLIGFICTEASYVACSLHFSAEVQSLDKNMHVSGLSKNLAISTMIFSVLQVLWQGFFLVWHIYCVCFNIKTDEWINWKWYPEFHLIVQSEPGEIGSENKIRFRNPYDKGVVQNLKEFLRRK